MAITVLSLVEEIRDQLGDYGEAVTSLTAVLATADAATASVSATNGFETNGFAYCEFEAMEISGVAEKALTVRRGARGTTATPHPKDTVVRFNLTWGNNLILAKLNEALDAAYPELYALAEDYDTLTVASNQYIYEVPTTINRLYRVEIETARGVFAPYGDWEMTDESHVRLYASNRFSTGTRIGLVGIAPFSPARPDGNLDARYPITDGNARGYLTVEAIGRLLMVPQARIARRDSFIGKTDGWDAGQPYLSMAVAREYLKQAKEFKTKARMPLPSHSLPNPGRSFLTAG